MPYRPQLPPLVLEGGSQQNLPAGSPIPEKAVTPVTAVTRLLSSMTLREFEVHGRPVEVRVPGVSETIWFVPGEPNIEKLAQRGIPRGRIWTTRELRALWCGGSVEQEDSKSLANIKATFDAEVIFVEDLNIEMETRDDG